MRLALPTRYLRTGLLSILFCIFLLSRSSESVAFSGTCNAGNIPYSTTYTCNTGYTGATPLFYSIETTSNIADAKYNVAMQNNGAQIVFRNVNGFFGATIFNLKIHYADGTVGPRGGTGSSAYEIAQSFGFTGTVTEWLNALKGEPGSVGATGTTQIVFATGQIFSGATFSLDSASDNATLDASGSYLPIVSKIDGTYYIDKDRMSELAVYTSFALFFFIMFGLYLYNRAVGKKSFY